MVVNQVDVKGIWLIEPEDHSPVSSNRNCPKSRQLALESVQSEGRQSHMSNRWRCVQNSQDFAKLLNVLGGDATRVVIFEQAFKAFVTKRTDH